MKLPLPIIRWCLLSTILTSFVTDADFCLAASQEIEQNDPTGSHKKHGRITAKTEKKIPYSCAFIWNRRGTCRKCAESTEEISANRHAVVDPFLSGLCSHAELFLTLSGISTNHTYFERYQDAWDVMATLEDTRIEDFSHTDEIHALPDTDSVIYQRANAVCSIGADAVSEEVKVWWS